MAGPVHREIAAAILAMILALAGTGACAGSTRAVAPASRPVVRLAPPAVKTVTIEAALMDGVDDWLLGRASAWPSEALIERARRDGDPEPAAAWARPVLLRLRGEMTAARAELSLIERRDDLPPAAARVLAFEHAVFDEPALAERMVAGDDLAAWLARASLARIRGDRAAEEVAWSHVRALDGGPRALAGQGAIGAFPDPTGEDAGLGSITARALPRLPAGCVEDRTGLVELRGALHRNPEEADRVARAFVDAVTVPECRIPAVVSELWRDGEEKRAEGWAEELVDEAPDSEPAAMLAAEAAARALDPPRSYLFVQEAESIVPPARRGGDAVRIAALMRSFGLHVAAIGVARLALSLLAGDERAPAYAEATAAQIAVGRADDAAATWLAARAELSPKALESATRRLVAALEAPPPSWLDRPRAAGPGDVVVALVQPRSAAVLDAALVWNPGSVELLSARALIAPVGSPARLAGMRALLLIGRADDGARGSSALAAVARLAEAEGRIDLARAARLEATMLPLP